MELNPGRTESIHSPADEILTGCLGLLRLVTFHCSFSKSNLQSHLEPSSPLCLEEATDPSSATAIISSSQELGERAVGESPQVGSYLSHNKGKRKIAKGPL